MKINYFHSFNKIISLFLIIFNEKVIIFFENVIIFHYFRKNVTIFNENVSFLSKYAQKWAISLDLSLNSVEFHATKGLSRLP